MKTWKLLVVDDDELVIQSIQLALPDHWSMVGVSSLEKIPDAHFHAAFVDMHLTGDITKPEGLKVIKHLASLYANLEIVAISGDLDRNLMENCLKAGASRFLSKPLSLEEIRLLLEKIEALFLLHEATARSTQTHTPWVGSSSHAQKIKRQVAELAGERGPILIEGESGTGKEVVARLLHGPNTTKPFISVNVSALPESVFESEVFGHVKGAFTGADQNKMGLAEAANGGDLFLDEIEALPLVLQAKLLRFLENGEIRRVGAKESSRVSVRVLVATNRNLEQMVKQGQFREDLMWRLNGKKLILPPLRERKEDIQAIAEYFLLQERPRRNKKLAPEALEQLCRYDFPGNVRELKRILEQVCLTSPLPIIRKEDIDVVLKTKTMSSIPNEDLDLQLGLANLVNDFEKRVVQKVLSNNKDIDEAAKTLQISRSSLYKKIKDYGIEV